MNDAVESHAITFDIICHGPDEADREKFLALKEAGNHDEAALLVKEQWRETAHNTVMTLGKNDLLNKYFAGSSYTAAWNMLLVGGSATISAADTLASHAGWTEITAYSGNRPAISWGSASAGSLTATASVFTMNASYTVAGAGCCVGATGTGGVLYDASTFGSSRTGASGDTLTITPTLSVS